MRLPTQLNTLVLFSLLLPSGAVLAQKEQWLQYHTTREERVYEWLNLTTNPPPDVALPKLSAKPYFAHWTTPMDPKGRWLCFDRSRKVGPYDRVFIDSTGDGRLDDKTALTASRIDLYSASFDPARVVFKGEDGPITYHLLLRFMSYGLGNDVRLLTCSGGFYSGTVDFGGKKHRIELIDGNVNGVFNDLATSSDDCDQVILDGSAMQALGRLLQVDGRFYRLEVARDGAFIKVQQADDVVLGTVRMPTNICEFTAVGENGEFQPKVAKGEVTLPAGAYRVKHYGINRKDERGASWSLKGDSFQRPAAFKVAHDKPVSLDIGEPIHIVMRPMESRSEVSFDLRFQGGLGEMIDITKDNDRPRPPRLTLTSLDGSYRYTNSFEFG